MGCAGSKHRAYSSGRAGETTNDNLIYPKPNYVLKTQRVVSGDKFFINVCTAVEMWPFPSILVSGLREDVDKRGNHCQCVDAVVHPEVLIGSNNQDTVNVVIIRRVTNELKAFDIAENKSALSFPAEESLSEDYKLPVVQNNYKGEKVGPIEMNMQNLAKSSLKNLEKASDTFVLVGKFKGMRNALEKAKSGTDKRILREHAVKLIQTAWRHHKKYILKLMDEEEAKGIAATRLQAIFRSKAARKSVSLLRQDLDKNEGFPPSKTGRIVKRGHIFRTWRERYFVLEKGVVTYYADERKKNQKGQVNIQGYRVGGHKKLNSFELYLSPEESGGKDLVLSFDDVAEKDEWRNAFESHIAAFNRQSRQISAETFSKIMV